MTSLILPIYRNYIFTEMFLTSLEESEAQNYELIIVDNSPTKTSEQMLFKFDIDEIIKNKVNAGTAKSYNQGAKKAAGDTLVFCCNDLVLPKYWLKRMLELKELHPSVGVLTAYSFSITSDKIVNYAFKQRFVQEKATPNNISDYDDLIYLLYQDWNTFTENFWKRNGETLIDGFSQLPMIDTELFNEIGGFCEELSYGYEDADFTDKIEDEGLSCKIASGVYVHHHIGAMTGQFKTGLKAKEKENLRISAENRKRRTDGVN